MNAWTGKSPCFRASVLRCFGAALGLVLVPAIAHANGFALDEQDAAAIGRGNTAGARAEASSAYYNPAGLTGVGPLQIELGGTGVASGGGATDADGTHTNLKGGINVPPYLYAARRDGMLAYGLSLNAPFGVVVAWPDAFPDRYEVQSVSFQTLAMMGSLAYQVSEPISVGVSVGAMNTAFDLTRSIDFVENDGGVHLHASGWGLAAIAGVRYTVGDFAAFGLSGSLPSPATLHGTARFHDVPVEFGPMTNDQDISTKVTLPGRLRLAGSFHVAPPIRLDADVAYTFWSSFNALNITFTDPNTPAASQEKGWKNGLTVHAGGEYALAGVADLRAGFTFDQGVTPIGLMTSDSPEGSRYQFAIGAGRELGSSIRADAALAYFVQPARQSQAVNYPASYSAHAAMLGVSLTWRMPEPGAPVGPVSDEGSQPTRLAQSR